MTTTGQVRHAFPALRIFVFGLEVTEDVLSCTLNYQDGRSPNTCEFVLASPLDRYIVTERDIHALFDSIELRDVITTAISSEDLATIANETRTGFVGPTRQTVAGISRVQQNINSLLRQRVAREIQDAKKARVLSTKIQERTPNIVKPELSNLLVGAQTPSSVAALNGSALTYPIQQGDAIFHSNDPVRVFWRDPFKPRDWYFMFSGFMTDWVDSVTANNERTITLRCEDPTRILRYARLTTNPGIFDIEEMREKEDAVIQSFFSDGFPELTVEEYMHMMLFGNAAAGVVRADGRLLPGLGQFKTRRVGINGSTETTANGRGAGQFNQTDSRVFLFGKESTVTANSTNPNIGSLERFIGNDLHAYQAHVTHKVLDSDLDTLKLPGDDTDVRTGLTTFENGEVIPEDIITVIGSNPHLFPVDCGRLFILSPISLGPSVKRTLFNKDIISSLNTYTTFKTRLGMIYDTLDRVDYSFYASPKGDLICENSLQDFRPEDFQGQGGSVAFRTQDTISWQRTFSDENVRTAMVAPWAPIEAFGGVTIQQVGQVPGKALLPHLVPAFGVRQETVDVRGFIPSKEAARIYAEIKLRQWNADARSAHVEVIPNVLCTWPNRPIEFTGDTIDGYAERAYMATTRKITHTIVWNGDMTMSLDVNRIRGWAGQLDENNAKLYEPIGGFASDALNAAILSGKVTPTSSTKELSDTERQNLRDIVTDTIDPLDLAINRALRRT